jgi:fructuronate reductase
VHRLSPAHLPATAAHPGPDRAARHTGIVHFGLGAFTRAHQAWYTDRAMAAAGGDWQILGVSLRSADVAAQLNPQGGLYTLAERSAAGTLLQVIGSVAEVVVAPDAPERIVAALAAPATHVVTFTVTEKGYCRRAEGGLDHDLAARGFYPLLAEGLSRRRAAGLAGLTLLSCDNLADNGHQLARLLGEWLDAADPALAAWTRECCTFPCSMVDRIVPATTPADRDRIEAELGLRDEGVVLTEPFSQWVIEDAFAGPRPAWDRVGAEIVTDVAPYETAKLRMLNGAHSLLAYCGLAAGHTFVHEAVADPALRALALRLMREEAIPTIAAAPGQDLAAYADALVERFANPALNHRLIQIAMDGSQKLPQRWMATFAANAAMGRDCPAIRAGLAAWFRHLRGANGPVDDPMADRLGALATSLDDAALEQALFGPGGLLAPA